MYLVSREQIRARALERSLHRAPNHALKSRPFLTRAQSDSHAHDAPWRAGGHPPNANRAAMGGLLRLRTVWGRDTRQFLRAPRVCWPRVARADTLRTGWCAVFALVLLSPRDFVKNSRATQGTCLQLDKHATQKSGGGRGTHRTTQRCAGVR